jgi:hypothetical protein
MTRAKEPAMTGHATGTYEARMAPVMVGNKPSDPSLEHLVMSRAFRGGLEGNSSGAMLTAATSVKDSAAFVAIEKVEGTLDGRMGSFILQHAATMSRGGATMAIMVVPDSGTGALAGLTGQMWISIEDGVHSYDFKYILPDAR